MRPAPDYALTYVTDPAAPCGLVETAVRAARGGAGVIQLRDKAASDADVAAMARALIAALAPFGVPLLVNDRVGAAKAAGAAGVHLGQGDLSVSEARAALGPEALIGLTIETERQLGAVDWDAVDYLGASPLRATATKPDATAPLGLDGVARIVRGARRPVVVIGGVTAADAAPLKALGAAGLAVVSAIAGAADPEAAARALRDAWRRG